MGTLTETPSEIHKEVSRRYGAIADDFKIEVQAEGAHTGAPLQECCEPGADASCCQPEAAGGLYSADTAWLPQDVTGLSLGCGDPITMAELQPGQVVVDLGSGGGIDCFLAARQVGPAGHVIGVDMTPAMLDKANRNKAKLGLENVEFRQGLIEALPVASDTADVIISNCVINLSPDKPAVFREAYRALKPGGRLAASDMVTLGRFGSEQRADMAAWSECMTGAEEVTGYVAALAAAGFENISVRDKGAPETELAELGPQPGAARLFSARVTALKPERNA